VKDKPFNRTGLKVTPIGLGLAALGRPGYINLGHAEDLQNDYDLAAMEGHAHLVLDAAWSHGVRYFDAARSYGRAESFLSSWLQSRQIDPASVVVGSKWGYTYTAGWRVHAHKHEVKEHTLPVLERQIGESRSLLGEYLDIYQIHSATLDSGVLENQSVLARLAELREEGLIIGLSLSGRGQADTLQRATEIMFDGVPLFRSVQATWNLLSREATNALKEAHATGMGVIIKEALANGRLTDRNQAPAFAAQRRLLEQAAEEANTTIDALALAAVLARPWVDVVLSGAAQRSHLLSNLKALEVVWTEQVEERLAGLAETAEEYWQTRSNLAWN
jgi:aryl-alcohol dehydrogenase-like predicted oxidoreductase